MIRILIKIIDFFSGLVYPDISSCMYCGRETRHGKTVCAECASEIEPINGKVFFDNFVCYYKFYYARPISNAVRQMKFNDSPWLAKAIATEISSLLANIEYDTITFVPMTKSDERFRGFNQGKLLAQNIGQAEQLLVKIKKTRPQHKLNAEQRMTNMVGAFELTGEVSGKNILIVDDVCTTGATLNECAKTLLTGGAKSVVCAVFAKTV